MMNTTPPHLPFELLPIQARILFFIYASAALARYRSQPPTPSGLASELELAWNRNGLCESDLSDPSRMTRLLEQHFAPLASNTGQARTNCCRAKEAK